MATKTNSKPCPHLKWSFFRKLLPAAETNSESWQTTKMEPFAKMLKTNSRNYFRKIPRFGCLTGF